MKKMTFALACALVLATCGSHTADTPEDRDSYLAPGREASAAEIDRAVQRSLESTIALSRATGEANTLISPASLTYALALASEGAQCETETEINVFIGAESDTRRSIYSQLAEQASKDDERYVTDVQSIVVDNAELDAANVDMLKEVAAEYGSEFVTDTRDNLLPALNSWVEEATGGL